MAITTDQEKFAVMGLGDPWILPMPYAAGPVFDANEQQVFVLGYPTVTYGSEVGATLKQCRSGIERAGASRANYFIPNVVVTINGVNRTSSVLLTSLTVTQSHSLDTPGSATFTLAAGATVPVVNQQITIGLGASTNLIFAGQVLSIGHVYQSDVPSAVLLSVSCVDWTRLFDRRLIRWRWENVSATTIVREIIAGWTSGFTSNNVVADLPVIEVFESVNETPSDALRRLAGLVGGTPSIDAYRDVHFTARQVILQTQFATLLQTGLEIDPNDPMAVVSPGTTQAGWLTGRQPTQPRVLTTGLGTLHAITYSLDGSQQRTRALGEGRVSKTILPTPAGVTSFPVTDTVALSSGTTGRIGSQNFTYTSTDIVGTNDGGFNSPGGTITQAANAGDQRLHISNANMAVNVTTGEVSYGQLWAIVGDQCVYGTSIDPINSTIEGIPATGFGALIHAVAIEEFINVLPAVFGVPASDDGSIQFATPVNTDVVATLEADDTTAQATLAVQEGGDGIREYLISESQLSQVAVGQLCLADLAVFHYPVITADWSTSDMNAEAGRVQPVSMASGSDTVQGNVLITQVVYTFLPVRETVARPPLRQCQGQSTPLVDLLNVLVTTGGV